MDNKIFKRLLREGIEARKNGQQKSVQEVFGKVASVDTGRGRRPASVRGDHDDEGDRTIPNFKEYSTSGCSEEEWEERIIDKGEDPKTVKCRGADEDEVGADEEEEKLIWGLTSENNPSSLVSLFKKYKILNNEQAKALIQKIIELSDELRSGINLEEQIEGDRAEKARVFNAEDTAELLQTIASFKLKKDVAKKLLRVLNLWGRMNTVRFEPPAEKVQLWADEEPSGDDREAKLAAKEKEWDEKGLNKAMGEPIGPDDEEYAEETPEETGEAGGEEEQTREPTRTTGAPVTGPDDEEYAEETPKETGEAGGENESVDRCDEILGALKQDPEMEKIIQDIENNETLRGAFRETLRSLGLAIDIVVLSWITISITVLAPLQAAGNLPGWASGVVEKITTALGSIVLEITQSFMALISAAISLSFGDYKGMMFDLFSSIPFGQLLGPLFKTAGKAVEPILKVADELTPQVALFIRGILKVGTAGTENAAKRLAGKFVEKGIEEKLAKKLADEVVRQGERLIKNSVQNLNIDSIPTPPQRNEGESDEDYKIRLKQYSQEAAKASRERLNTMSQEAASCLNNEGANTLEKGVRTVLGWIDEAADKIPEFLVKIAEFVKDPVDTVLGSDDELASHAGDGKDAASLPPEDGGPPYTIHRENLNLNEQKYIMLLERFKIK